MVGRERFGVFNLLAFWIDIPSIVDFNRISVAEIRLLLHFRFHKADLQEDIFYEILWLWLKIKVC